MNDTPDISPYKKLEVISKENSKRELIATNFIKEGAYLTASFDNNAVDQRLYVQVEECRNSADSMCKRRFFSGDYSGPRISDSELRW